MKNAPGSIGDDVFGIPRGEKEHFKKSILDAPGVILSGGVFSEDYLVENISSVIIAYLSSLCNIQFSAFQYALLSSFMSFSRTWLASPAGWIIDNLSWDKYFNFFGINLIQNSSWIGFFIVTALFSIPAIILLHFVQDKRK